MSPKNHHLVGCGAVDFPPAGCIVGNSSNSDLGIASFISKISPDSQITLTVGTSSTSPSNMTEDVLVKRYYLSTPPTLDLNNATSFSACALFFEGISKNLPLNSTTQYDSVTCDEVLQASCVDDLLAQAARKIQNLTRSSSATDSSLCQSLQASLQTLPPKSCPPAVGGSWGTIVARDITGPDAPERIALSSCHSATGGNDYIVYLVETQSLIAEPVFADPVVLFLYGITPVLTVFYDGEGESALQMPETHLSCMKIVSGFGNSTAQAGDAARLSTPPLRVLGLSSTMWLSGLAMAGVAYISA